MENEIEQKVSEDKEKKNIFWDQRKNIGFLRALFLTVRDVLFSPGSFFDSIAGRKKDLNSVLFFMAIAVLSIIGSVISGPVLGVLFKKTVFMPTGLLLIPMLIFTVCLGPFFMVVSLYIASGIIHFFAKIFKGAADFTETLNVLAFSSSAQLFSLIPVIGGIIAFIWLIIVQGKGISRIHGISLPKAFIVIASPILIFGLFALAVILTMLVFIR